MTGCGCHGGDGIAHLSCLVRAAKLATEDGDFSKWQRCSDCDQQFHGVVEQALAWNCWKTYLPAPESNEPRNLAMGVLGAALVWTNAEAALPVLESHIATIQRFWPHSPVEIGAHANVAMCYDNLGRLDDAVRSFRELYAIRLRIYGPNNEDTIIEANNLIIALSKKHLWAEVIPFARKQLEISRKTLGAKHAECVHTANIYAAALCNNPAATRAEVLEAVKLLEEAIKTARYVLGPQHPRAVTAAMQLRIARSKLAQL